jgi:hypothetical protein
MSCPAANSRRGSDDICLPWESTHSHTDGFCRRRNSTLGTAFRRTAASFIGQWHIPRAGTLAIKIEICYNTAMVLLQSIVVVTLVSVLYLYLRQSNQD